MGNSFHVMSRPDRAKNRKIKHLKYSDLIMAYLIIDYLYVTG